MKLHVVQAEHGDCFILEYDTPSGRKHILIDGGPADIYQQHLRGKLLDIQAGGGKLDLAILSHVDDDHVQGLLDLMSELQRQHDTGLPETIPVAKLWHNTFSQTLGGDVEARLSALMVGAAAARGVMVRSDKAARSISQGDQLTQLADGLDVRINREFAPQHLICIDEAPDVIPLDGLKLRIVGPTRKNLEKLRKDWLRWLKKQEKRAAVRGPALVESAAREIDASVPNLSSIMVLAEMGGKKILFTGDGRGDHLLQGLAQAGLLGRTGTLHVDILKVPHHGSQRNVSIKFFKAVTADRYVIGANGQNGNPDLGTLKWIVQAAREQDRTIEIVVTNATDATRQLVADYPPGKYGYRVTEMKPGENAMPLELGA